MVVDPILWHVFLFFFAFFKHFMVEIDEKSCFNIKKNFQAANSMQSTHLLVEIHNTQVSKRLPLSWSMSWAFLKENNQQQDITVPG